MRQDPKASRVARLYCAMPGAPLPPTIDGWYEWGEVEGNDHWGFCELIIDAIDAAVAGKDGAE